MVACCIIPSAQPRALSRHRPRQRALLIRRGTFGRERVGVVQCDLHSVRRRDYGVHLEHRHGVVCRQQSDRAAAHRHAPVPSFPLEHAMLHPTVAICHKTPSRTPTAGERLRMRVAAMAGITSASTTSADAARPPARWQPHGHMLLGTTAASRQMLQGPPSPPSCRACVFACVRACARARVFCVSVCVCVCVCV